MSKIIWSKDKRARLVRKVISKYTQLVYWHLYGEPVLVTFSEALAKDKGFRAIYRPKELPPYSGDIEKWTQNKMASITYDSIIFNENVPNDCWKTIIHEVVHREIPDEGDEHLKRAGEISHSLHIFNFWFDGDMYSCRKIDNKQGGV